MPRRRAGEGIDFAASVYENVIIDFEGKVRLASKNQMQNPLLNEFTPTGELAGWTLDRTPEQVGTSYYGGAYGTTVTKQASHDLNSTYHDQNELFVSGDPLPDASHQSEIGPYSLPPYLALVQAAGGVGYPAGWWGLTHQWFTAGYLATQLGPLVVFHLDSGQGVQMRTPTSAPSGAAYWGPAMIGPYATENDALNAPAAYVQNIWATSPRLPAVVTLPGPYVTFYLAYFHINGTYLPPPPPPPPPTPPVAYPEPAAAVDPGPVAAQKKHKANNNRKR